MFLTTGVLFLGVSFLQTCFATPISTYSSQYTGYQVWAVQPETGVQVKFLNKLEQLEEYDFWTPVHQNHDVDIMVPPTQLNLLGLQLKQFGMNFKVKIMDLGLMIEEQRIQNNLLRKDGKMSWTAFHTYDEIVSWLQSLPALYPDLATLEVIGQSYEGRDIHVLKVSKNNGHDKPAIFLDATFHAREWISPATLTWVINEILTKPDQHSLLSKADLFFVPIVNPDGYEYSHTTSRLWRKTRNPNSGSPYCPGIDLNRNMPYKFGGSGSSGSPCSETYRGASALSAPETKAVADFVEELQKKQNVHAYLSLHSYGNYWLLPWNYERGVYPDDFYTHSLPWGQDSVKAIKGVHGESYRTGQGADILYAASGGSHDWAKSIGIKYCATAELRGGNGFTPPPSEIIPTAEEIFAGILVLETTIKQSH